MPVVVPGLDPVRPVSLEINVRPNIIVWAPDDFGMDAWRLYADRYSIGQYDSTLGNIPTPNLDALVQRGVKFTRAYSQPFCSPTRAQWMSGRFGFKTGVGALVDANDQPLLDLEVGLPKALKQATNYAYKCGVFGKWHLSNYSSMGGMASHPLTVGFDEFYGTQGNVDFQGYYFFEGWHSKKTDTGIEISMDRIDRYMPEWIIEKALDWINRTREPWLAYLPVHLPHGPQHRPPADLYDTTKYVLPEEGENTDNSYPSPAAEKLAGRTYFSAMVQAMDTLFGRFLDGIPQEVLANTVIILWSDNGTEPGEVGGNLNGAKSKYTAFDLGVNIPMVVAGAGVAAPGRTSTALISPSDLLATVVDIGQGSIGLVGPAPNHATGAFTGTRNSTSFWNVCVNPAATPTRTSLLVDKFAYNIPHLNASVIGLRAVVTLYQGKYYKLIRFNGTGTTFTGTTETPPGSGIWVPDTRTDGDAFYDLEADPREDINYLRASGAPLTLTTTQKGAYDQARTEFANLQTGY